MRFSSRENSDVPALALAPCLIDTVGGTETRTLEHELLDRATQPDFRAWLAGVGIANGCIRPIRLRGTIRDINPATGEVVRKLDAEPLPDGVLYRTSDLKSRVRAGSGQAGTSGGLPD
jgi:hypothetical protein